MIPVFESRSALGDYRSVMELGEGVSRAVMDVVIRNEAVCVEFYE